MPRCRLYNIGPKIGPPSGPRRGSRIQKGGGGGGGSYIQKGGGVRTGISGADPNCCRALGKSTSKQKLQTAVGGGGGSDHPKEKPVGLSAPGPPPFFLLVDLIWTPPLQKNWFRSWSSIFMCHIVFGLRCNGQHICRRPNTCSVM